MDSGAPIPAGGRARAGCFLSVGLLLLAAAAVLAAVRKRPRHRSAPAAARARLRDALKAAVQREDWSLAADLQDAERLLRSAEANASRDIAQATARAEYRAAAEAQQRLRKQVTEVQRTALEAGRGQRRQRPYRVGDIELDSELRRMAEHRSLGGDIVFSIATGTAVHWAMNLVLGLERYGVHHYFVVALDDRGCGLLFRAGISCGWTSFGTGPGYEWAPKKDPMGRAYRLERSKYRTLRRLADLGLRPLFLDADISVRANPYPALERMSRFAFVTGHGGALTCLAPLACLLYCRRCKRGGAAYRLLEEMEFRWRRFRNQTYWEKVFWRRLDAENATAGPHREHPFHRANNMLADITASSCCGKHVYPKVKPSTPRVIHKPARVDQVIGSAAMSGCNRLSRDQATGALWRALHYLPAAGGGTPAEGPAGQPPASDADTFAVVPPWLLANWNGWGAGRGGDRGLFSDPENDAQRAPLWHFLGAPGSCKTQLMRALGQWDERADQAASAAGILGSGGGAESFNAHRDPYLHTQQVDHTLQSTTQRWLRVTGTALRASLDEPPSLRDFVRRYAFVRALVARAAQLLSRAWVDFTVSPAAAWLPRADRQNFPYCKHDPPLCAAHLNLLQGFPGEGRVPPAPQGRWPPLLPAVVLTPCPKVESRPFCGTAMWRFNGTPAGFPAMPECGKKEHHTPEAMVHLCTPPGLTPALFERRLQRLEAEAGTKADEHISAAADPVAAAARAAASRASVVTLSLGEGGAAAWQDALQVLRAFVGALPNSSLPPPPPCGRCARLCVRPQWNPANWTALLAEPPPVVEP